MQHTIPVEMLGPLGEVMGQAVAKCVHCGFCLPACPTYNVLGEEMDSPRGRIILMKSVLEGELELADALLYIDRCLGCLGCVTACPSGVQYGELLSPFRAYAQERRQRPLVEKATRTLMLNTIPQPGRFRLAARAGRLAKPVKAALPDQFQSMLGLLPESLEAKQPLPEVSPAEGKRRARVALLAGCVQRVVAPQINRATLYVLAKNGVEVVIPRGQGCCGALAMHTGEMEMARAQGRVNLAAFPQDVDAILTNAAGCGSGMKEYELIFKGTEYEEQAEAFVKRVQDVTQFLDALGLTAPPEITAPFKLAYQDACHLAHAQGITAAPRRLLAKIPNLEVLPIPEAELCCGSAGTYNIEQPELARRLGERKVQNILNTGAQAVASGNIGCMVQMRTHLGNLGQAIPVWHTMEVLSRAYAGWS
jgi:glycolate dehydrogenase iron-sulfur subunit